MNPEHVARIAHEANRAYCESIGDDSQKSWSDADEWQRVSSIGGVNYLINNPGISAEELHQKWRDDKVANGWRYGPIKDATIKEHPCIVAYSQLPPEQRIKDYIFSAIVDAFIRAESEERRRHEP